MRWSTPCASTICSSSKIQVGDSGYAYLVAANGNIIAHRDASLILNEQANIGHREVGKEMLAAKKGFFLFREENEDWLACIDTMEKTGWLLVVQAKVPELFAGLETLKKTGVFITVALIGLLALALVLFINPVLRVLQQVTAYARELQHGDLRLRLPLRRSDELGDLATALNRLADSSRDRAELAEKIAGGDLTCEVQLLSGEDQMGKALAGMLRQLQRLIGDIRHMGQQLAAGIGAGSRCQPGPIPGCDRAGEQP